MSAPSDQTQSIPVFPGYTVIDTIGVGGMGAVYKAEKDNVTYALKTILPDCVSIETLARFEREALAAAAVDKHPNIVSVHKLELDASPPYIVMDYVEGQGLDQLIEGGKPWSPERVLELLKPLASALDHMHNKGVIHRDLKPANILIRDHDSAPLITDFGLAKDGDLEALTRTGEMLGTPSYMAPEQFLGETCSSQTDVWALAVIAFEILSGGHRPFAANSALALAQRAMLSEPASLTKLNKNCPIDVETVIFKALRKKVEHRYESCGEFIEDLGRAVRGEAILGRREGFAKRKGRAAYQKLGLTGLVMLIILITSLLAIGVYFWDQRRNRPSKKLKRAIAHLKKEKEKYGDHFKQHILWQLGAENAINESCPKFHEASALVYKNSGKKAGKKLALHYLPCYPDAELRDNLIAGLTTAEGAFLRAFLEFKKGQFEEALTLLKDANSDDRQLRSAFLKFAIHCKRGDYRAALASYNGIHDSLVPTWIKNRLKAHDLIRQVRGYEITSSKLSESIKAHQKNGELDFLEEWQLAANNYFDELTERGVPKDLLRFYEYYYELRCINGR
ncbi:MAG: serine/threonine-protein kinase, partial [Planctomycetota bacterium]|nr:serine/threonine-protein kinase [Planctomycetota bacterium]